MPLPLVDYVYRLHSDPIRYQGDLNEVIWTPHQTHQWTSTSTAGHYSLVTELYTWSGPLLTSAVHRHISGYFQKVRSNAIIFVVDYIHRLNYIIILCVEGHGWMLKQLPSQPPKVAIGLLLNRVLTTLAKCEFEGMGPHFKKYWLSIFLFFVSINEMYIASDFCGHGYW